MEKENIIGMKKKYYNGDYVDGIKEGNGEIVYEDGKKFICPFVKGKPNGIGFYVKGNQKKEVEFINGKINKNYKKNSNDITNNTYTNNNNNVFSNN